MALPRQTVVLLKSARQLAQALPADAILLLTETDLDWDYGRAPLPRDLGPGDGEAVTLRLRAPAEEGLYLIELDMVAEHLTWFEDLGSSTVRHLLRVE